MLTARAKEPRRYVVWMATESGCWRPVKTVSREQAERLPMRDERMFRVVPAPYFDPQEDE